MSGFSATLMLVDGHCVVTAADDLIHVTDGLWDEINSGKAADVPGGAVLDGDVLTFGTPGQGLGQVRYRYLRHYAEAGWHILQRIDTGGRVDQAG